MKKKICNKRLFHFITPVNIHRNGQKCVLTVYRTILNEMHKCNQIFCLHFCQLCVCLHVIVIRKDMCPCNVKNASFVTSSSSRGGGGGRGRGCTDPSPPPPPTVRGDAGRQLVPTSLRLRGDQYRSAQCKHE